MKKMMMTLAIALLAAQAWAGDGDSFLDVNVGFLFPSTLNASLGYERELSYGDAVELSAEMGNHWQKNPATGKADGSCFWKGYYWDGTLVYKHCLKHYKNGQLRLRIGPLAGAEQGDFYYGAEGGLEYSYYFPSGWQLTVCQKNNVCFKSADTFRNGLTVGVKIPL